MDKSDIALASINKSNNHILLLTVITMAILLLVGGIAIKQLNDLTVQGQNAIKEQSVRNAELIKALSKANDEAHIRQLKYVQCVSSIPEELRSPQASLNCLSNVYPDAGVTDYDDFNVPTSERDSSQANPPQSQNQPSSQKTASPEPAQATPAPQPVPTTPPTTTPTLATPIDQLKRILGL